MPRSSIAARAKLNDLDWWGNDWRTIQILIWGLIACLRMVGGWGQESRVEDQGGGNCLVDAWAIVNHKRLNGFYHVGARKCLLVHDDVWGPAAYRRLIWPFNKLRRKLRKLELRFSHTPEFLFTISLHLLDDALRYRTTSMGL